MRVLIVPDHFKGSLSAGEAAEAMHAGFSTIFPHWQYQLLPLADGGEGTLDLLLQSMPGRRVAATVQDPLGREISAEFGLLDGKRTALIEMAQASGLLLLRAEERNPLRSSSTGTGELLRAALNMGCTRIILGIGGSATNDGGMGLLTALGLRFFDDSGHLLTASGAALEKVAKIDTEQLDTRLQHCAIEVMCDVDNPLLGESGATRMFGKQKGANATMLASLEAGMTNYADHLEQASGICVNSIPGSGAAGGVGAACLAFLGARLRPGIAVLADLLDLRQKIADADLVLSGEGCVDAQTLHGKTIAGVAQICRELGKPLIVLAGSRSGNPDTLREAGISVIVTSLPGLGAEAELFAAGAAHLRETAQNTARLLDLGMELRRP